MYCHLITSNILFFLFYLLSIFVTYFQRCPLFFRTLIFLTIVFSLEISLPLLRLSFFLFFFAYRCHFRFDDRLLSSTDCLLSMPFLLSIGSTLATQHFFLFFRLSYVASTSA